MGRTRKLAFYVGVRQVCSVDVNNRSRKWYNVFGVLYLAKNSEIFICYLFIPIFVIAFGHLFFPDLFSEWKQFLENKDPLSFCLHPAVPSKKMAGQCMTTLPD